MLNKPIPATLRYRILHACLTQVTVRNEVKLSYVTNALLLLQQRKWKTHFLISKKKVKYTHFIKEGYPS